MTQDRDPGTLPTTVYTRDLRGALCLIRNKKGEDLPDSWESQQENTRNPSPPVTKVLDTNKCVCEGGGYPDDKPSSVTYQFNQLLFAECLQNFAQLWDQM